MKQAALFLFLLLILVSLNPQEVSAHKSGCHRWHSCPSDIGSYVCGDLGYYSECPSYPSIPVVQSAASMIPETSQQTVKYIPSPTVESTPKATRKPSPSPTMSASSSAVLTPQFAPTPTSHSAAKPYQSKGFWSWLMSLFSN